MVRFPPSKLGNGPEADVNGQAAMSIGWNTYDPPSEVCVQYGTSPDALSLQQCSGSSMTYDTSRTTANAVTLSGLAPATTYYYKVSSTNSTVKHFFSPRAPGDKTPFAVNAVIDLGVYGVDGFTIQNDMSKRDLIPHIQPALNHTTIGRLATTIDDYELVLHPGDFAYADDWYLKQKNALHGAKAFQAILENFYDQLAPIAGRKPYMVGPGNHEALLRFGPTMPTAFASTSADEAARVNANKARMLARPPFWFSFEYGMRALRRAGQQLEFLEADLASVDRAVTPWVIVSGHRPWYTTGSEPCKPCQAAFEPLLYKYGVDLGVFGHVHNSQRFQPVYAGRPDPNGLADPKAPMYIVAGGAGNIEGLSGVGTKRPAFSAFAYADDFSYGQVSFLDANRLRVDFIRSATGETLDTSVLYKSHTERFVVQA
ncbi:hypothetical protein PG994_013677 [Apiospora phragmitis]|uniref:Purple acid phosphatase n=1 Tax=Apiospora phragmitis TaxID=2905665 RepID=A0ABR1T9B8_9PEZI